MDITTPKAPIAVDANKSPEIKTASVQDAEDLAQEYYYKRSISIKPIETLSAYRQKNIAVMGRRTSNIGSSINSVNTLCANAKEMAVLYPNIIGLSSNNADFHFKVKEYLSNIQVTVSDKITFNSSLRFKHKSDYLNFKHEEEVIENAYANADKREIRDLKIAIKRKTDAINKLESTYIGNELAFPEAPTDYILYRHCLLYNSVAKEPQLIGGDKNIRFYLVDEQKEKNKQAKLLRDRKAANSNFIAICGDDEKFNAVFVRYCVDNNLSLVDYTAKDRVDKELLIDQFSRENPVKFNAICNDSNLLVVSFIERLIARGELVRAEYNQQISMADGTFVGKNMIDAIAFFNNPNNKAIKDGFETKLKVLNY